jgi:hypothetical protein
MKSAQNILDLAGDIQDVSTMHASRELVKRRAAELWKGPRKRLVYLPSILGLAITGIVWWFHHSGTLDTAVLGYICTGLIVSGFILLVALHVVDRKLVPLNTVVSDYALSPRWGFLLNADFVVVGIDGFLLGSLFWGSSVWLFGACLSTAGTLILFLSFLTARSTLRLVAGETEGDLHDICIVTGVLFTLVSMAWFAFLPIQLGRFEWARAVAVSQFNLGGIAGLAYGIVILVRRKGDPNKPVVGEGLCERLLLVILLLWVGFLSVLASLGVFNSF